MLGDLFCCDFSAVQKRSLHASHVSSLTIRFRRAIRESPFREHPSVDNLFLEIDKSVSRGQNLADVKWSLADHGYEPDSQRPENQVHRIAHIQNHP